MQVESAPPNVTANNNLPSEGEQVLKPVPLVECDKRLSEMVEGIEVDAEYFARVMAWGGMAPEDISKTRIFMSAATVIREDEQGRKIV